MQYCRLFSSKNYFCLLYLLIFILFFSSSCRTIRYTSYFETLGKDTSINQFVNKNIESKIVKNDILAISVSSLNRDEDEFYNQSSLSTKSSSGSGSQESLESSSRGQGYEVDLEGNIQIHNIGKIHAEGLTRKELKDSLEILLLPFLKDPIVTVNFLNRRITVLGEVSKPQVIDMQQEEQIPLLDVLATTGDITSNGLKRDVLVLRETPNGKIFKHVNLENESLFKDSSRWYYLQSGDIVYVRPDVRKLTEQERASRIQQVATISLAIVTIALLIAEISR